MEAYSPHHHHHLQLSSLRHYDRLSPLSLVRHGHDYCHHHHHHHHPHRICHQYHCVIVDVMAALIACPSTSPLLLLPDRRKLKVILHRTIRNDDF